MPESLRDRVARVLAEADGRTDPQVGPYYRYADALADDRSIADPDSTRIEYGNRHKDGAVAPAHRMTSRSDADAWAQTWGFPVMSRVVHVGPWQEVTS